MSIVIGVVCTRPRFACARALHRVSNGIHMHVSSWVLRHSVLCMYLSGYPRFSPYHDQYPLSKSTWFQTSSPSRKRRRFSVHIRMQRSKYCKDLVVSRTNNVTNPLQPYHDGAPAFVRRQEYIFPRKEWVAIWQRLFLRDIQRGACDLLFVECPEQGVPEGRSGVHVTISCRRNVRVDRISPPNVDHNCMRRQVL